MRILIFFVLVTTAISNSLHKKNLCDDVFCKAGRECVVLEGKGECLCQISCPDHLKPVCGSDGESYDNHCLLHQEACMTDIHIRAEHNGYCKEFYKKSQMFEKKEGKKKRLEREMENELIDDIKRGNKMLPTVQQTPAVCYSPQRNALRFLIVANWEESLKNQTWHVEGMTFRESLWGWFYTCDTNKNNYLSVEELLSCSKKVSFFARPGQEPDITKALCIDAMVSEGDSNLDYRLDFSEFTNIMNPEYKPKMKKCSLEGKDFVDGEEVQVDCNHCICAVGKWVCASKDCSRRMKNTRNKSNHLHEVTNDVTEDIIPIHNADLLGDENIAKKYFENEEKDQLLLKHNTIIDNYENYYEKTKNKNPKKYKNDKSQKKYKIMKQKTNKIKKYWEDKLMNNQEMFNSKIYKKSKKYAKYNKNLKGKKKNNGKNHIKFGEKY